MTKLPVLLTGHKVIDKAFKIAMSDIAVNVITTKKEGLLKRSGTALRAGLDYDLWIRDSAINTWNGAGLIFPKATYNSMFPFLEKKSGTYRLRGDQQWDAIIWIVGAWWQYLYTGDRKFLRFICKVSKDLIKYYESNWYDKKTGLFIGGGVTLDGGSGYPDEMMKKVKEVNGVKVWKDWGAKRADPKFATYKTLSTNCTYYYAYAILAEMQEMLEGNIVQDWRNKAVKLKTAINKHFWDEKKGYYRFMLSKKSKYAYQEGIGQSFALLFDIAGCVRKESIFAKQFTSKHGVAKIWPSLDRFKKFEKGRDFGHMNYVIWPEVNGFWAHAAAKHNKQHVFDFELLNLAKKAVRDGNFMEIYNPITGKPYGGLSDYPENAEQKPHKESKFYMWHVCRRQTWCATAYFRMITMGLFGMNFTKDGITFKPHMPKELHGAYLKNLKYAKMDLNIKVVGKGTRVKEITSNGISLSGAFLPNTLKGPQNISITLE